MKRFYRETAVAEDDAGYQVTLDGRAVRTPAKAKLALPTRTLAEAIAAEWDEQETEIQPHRMPMMQLASTAIDRVRPRRDDVITEIATYAETDLLCYRADSPTSLVTRQAQEWQPMLDWAAGKFDAPLAVTEGIIPVAQPEGALRALRATVASCDEFVLSALYTLTTVSGSLVLALAVRDSAMEPEAAFDASHLDEEWQASQWGRDEHAQSRRERSREEILAAARFLAHLRG
jgi:chaperone required for assembly of F1-ATPase